MADLNTLRELCAKMQGLQTEKDTLEESLKMTNAAIDELRLKQIPEMMDQIEVKNATFPGIGRVQLAGDLYCSTKAGQKDAAMQWLRDMEMDGMISETYNASSMKALVRRLIEQGADIPECLNVTPFIRASIVKA
jgi:NAD-specific glutamate dehydrogenase